MKIYPEIEMYPSFRGGLYFLTALRKKHTDGKWYLVRFDRELFAPDNDAINMFHKEVYRFLIQGIIDPGLKSAIFGADIYPVDEDQRDESERLSELFEV